MTNRLERNVDGSEIGPRSDHKGKDNGDNINCGTGSALVFDVKCGSEGT